MAGQSSSSGTSLPATILTTQEAHRVVKDAPASAQNQATLPGLSTHFSQSQIALALSIQKSRPEGVSSIGRFRRIHESLVDLTCSTEYCQQLRKNIRTGQATKEPRYVDSTDFWKDQYSKIHLENKALQDKVLRLEEETRLIRESIDRGADQNGEPSLVPELLEFYGPGNVNPRKRRAPDEVECWLQDQQNHETRLPSYLDDNSLRLNGYSMYSFFLHIVLEGGIRTRLSELSCFLSVFYRQFAMHNGAHY